MVIAPSMAMKQSHVLTAAFLVHAVRLGTHACVLWNSTGMGGGGLCTAVVAAVTLQVYAYSIMQTGVAHI